jgi:ribosomal protein L14E/L6E/L27E
MEPDCIRISDVVVSTAGRDRDQLFYVIGTEGVYTLLCNGKDRTLEKPKRKKCKHVNKVLCAETRVAAKLLAGDKVLNSELRKDLAYIRQNII